MLAYKLHLLLVVQVQVVELCFHRGGCCAGRHSEQQRFYEELYAVVDEPESVLQALVRQKEEFARRACSLALQDALQLPCCWEHACAD